MLHNNDSSHARPHKLLAASRAFALCFVCSLAFGASVSAQEERAAKEQKASGAAVRERRALVEGSKTKDETGAVEKNDAAASKADEDAALEELKAKIKDSKSDVERARLHRTLADSLASQGRKADAVSELRAMLAEERFDPPHFYNVGNALARLDESNAAVEAYRKAIAQKRGNYSRALHNLGVVLTRLGRWEEARESLEAAVRLEGGIYPEASYSLGRLHALRGEAGLAINEWTRALAHWPDHTDAAIALARTLAEEGDAEHALEVLDAFSTRAARRGTTVPREIETARGEVSAALNVSKDSDREGPRVEKRRASSSTSSSSSPVAVFTVDPQTYDFLRRARVAREGGREDESVALYRRVIERRGGYFAPANLELGLALITLRRGPEAIETLRKVAERDGARTPVASYHLGRLYESAGDLARSREAFARAVAFYGESNPQPLLDLVRVCEKLGDLRAAADALATYVRLTARMGATPEWATTHLEELRRKLAPAASQEK